MLREKETNVTKRFFDKKDSKTVFLHEAVQKLSSEQIKKTIYLINQELVEIRKLEESLVSGFGNAQSFVEIDAIGEKANKLSKRFRVFTEIEEFLYLLNNLKMYNLPIKYFNEELLRLICRLQETDGAVAKLNNTIKKVCK